MKLQQLIVVTLATLALPSFAGDLESGVRNLRHHGRWMSMEFRDPNFGGFVAARASSTDPRSDISLNVTYAKRGNGCSEDIEIVIKTTDAVASSIDRSAYVEFQVDDRKPHIVQARTEATEGDYFVYMRITDRVVASDLVGKNSIMINTRGMGTAEYPMRGMADSLREAKASCLSYLAH